MSEFTERLERATRDGARVPLGAGSSAEDIAAAFRAHHLLEPNQPPHVPVRAEIVSINEADLMRWYVARVDSSGADKVERDIRENGVKAYQPKLTTWRIVKRPKKGQPRKRAVTSSLFTGYLFVSFDEADTRGFGALRSIHGFHDYVRPQGRAPLLVEKGKVAKIMSEEQDGVYDETRERPSKFSEGRLVRITTGPFAGMTGSVSKLKTGDRIVVMMDFLFGSSRAVTVMADALELRA